MNRTSVGELSLPLEREKPTDLGMEALGVAGINPQPLVVHTPDPVDKEDFPPLPSQKQTPNYIPTSWNALFNKSKSSIDCSLTYNVPNIVDGVIYILDEVIEVGNQEWKDYLVGFFVEKRLPFPVVREALKRQWKLKADFEMPPVSFFFSTTLTQSNIFISNSLVVASGIIAVDGSAFVGATWDEQSCRHIFNLGVLQYARLLCLYRFKLWWMIPRVGNSGSDVLIETQMLLLESKEQAGIDNEESVSYVLLLPVLDGEFRSSLQGNSAKELQVCVESGEFLTRQFQNS
ncbi:hypothetical protein AQUCO_07800007v1 [Aquilegia coerulea]|uniref:Uncharacterized protein n=1 Tax=Aquilegia coerulea TaxID=218851 RepID=A0A2G5C7V5_AQUCA|nr:hypothetical protein AQUCO_07800007v1 [Aquilegia coerulea]